MSVGGPLEVIITYIHHIFIEMAHQGHFWHFKINADISISDNSVILGLPLTPMILCPYWLPDRIKAMNRLWKTFDDGVRQVPLNMHKMPDFTNCCYLPPSQLKVLHFETCG